MIFDEYEAYVLDSKKRFGDRLVVLLECGSFFEIYEDGSGLVDIRGICDLLNIIVSRRNKSIQEVSRNNFMMAGFPAHCLKKFVNILLNDNYVVVLVTQVTPPPNPKRAITDVLSPGINLENFITETNNVMNVFVAEHQRFKSDIIDIAVGCSVVDVTTGECWTKEFSTFHKDPSYVYDELYRICSAYSPKEIEIVSTEHISQDVGKAILEVCELKRGLVCNKLGQLDTSIIQPAYQNELITRVYKDIGMITPVEYLGLERTPLSCASFARLIQYIFLHNEKVLQKLSKPIIIEDTSFLLLNHNAAEQLDIIGTSTSKTGTLLSLLNNCKTAMGRRYFKHCLLHPMIDDVAITKVYDDVSKHVFDYEVVREQLSKVYDMERLWRKVCLKSIAPCEFITLLDSIDVSGDLTESFTYNLDNQIARDKLHLYTNDTIDHDMFTDEHPELYEIKTKLKDILLAFDDVVNNLNREGNYFKLDSNDKDGFYITTTNKRWQEYVASKGSKGFKSKQLTNQVRIIHETYDKLNDKYNSLKVKAFKLGTQVYQSILKTFANSYSDQLISLIKLISYLDYVTTLAYNSVKHQLVRPLISSSKHPSSYIKANGLRHLLIEANQKDTEYISNDISLDKDQQGVLLYGINSAGKSSLMKSIGLLAIMAQAGMFVPCESCEFSPFTKVFTRIHSSDDILKGHSTFTKEMLELRNIIARADETSLVIGDELCSGTESVSALSIVSSGLIHLHDISKSRFVFATHLHDLIEIDEVKALNKLKVYHLSVVYDEALKCLVYNRKLAPGNGSTLYGIEVCKALDMSNEFVERANRIRHKLTGSSEGLVSTKRSSYNNDIIVDKCMICLQTSAHEVHHIKEQHTADEKGYIGTYHKNSKFNLVPICEDCHHAVHQGRIHIKGYKHTTQGRMLHTEKNKIQEDIFDDHIIYMNYNEISQFKTKKQAAEDIIKTYNITKYKLTKIIKKYAET